MDLSSFIGVSEWSEFANAYRTRQFAAHPAAEEPDRFRSLWSQWELDAQCRFTGLAADEGFRLFTRGKMVPREAYLGPGGGVREDVLKKLWSSGVSITLRYLEDYSNPTLALTRSLETALHCPVQVNLYVTPGEGQGLGAHFDDHDVLVLQIQGTKTWDIYAGSDGVNGLAEPAGAHVRPPGPPTVVTLERGGWVYVPRGVWHEVRNKATEPSIHFTVSFHPLSWGRLLQEGLAKARRREPAFNVACPIEDTGYVAQVEKYLAMIPAFVDSPAKYYREFKNLAMPVPPAELIGRATLEAATESTVFAWRAEQVETREDGLVLSLGYRRRPLQLRPEYGPTTREMAQKKLFRPAEITSLDPAAALLLCKLLANVGVLRLTA
jgi:cupin superfamily protein